MATLRPLTPGAATCFTCPSTGPRKKRTRGSRAEGQVMTGDEVRQVLEAMLPQGEIDCLCAQFGVIERQRKLKLGMFVRAMVISAGTPGGAYQADVLRSYLEFEVPPVARSAFYRWFDEPLERFMAALADRALAYARAQQVDLSGPLCGVTDWYIVDATTVTVRDALREEFPGTGGYAAIKVHKILSVGCGAPVQYHFSPAREHDSRHLQIEESWRGYGLLADLAYASLDRLRACDTHGVRYVIRLKENWKPKVDHIARGQVTQEFFPGTDFDALLEDNTLVLDGRTIDADVHGGRGRHTLALRLVGVQTPKGYCFFLTNLPPRIGPRQVADLYRVRWEVELRIRLDKSVNRLDAIDADQPCTLKTLLHASLIASTIAALLAHTHNIQTRPQQEGAPRTQAPLHPRRLALQLAVSCQSIAQAFELTGTEATRRWDKIAELLTHSGKDPNWRRRPSVLDQLRGWKRQPLARKQANSRDLSPRNIKEAA
jgi:putative transposase